MTTTRACLKIAAEATRPVRRIRRIRLIAARGVTLIEILIVLAIAVFPAVLFL